MDYKKGLSIRTKQVKALSEELREKDEQLERMYDENYQLTEKIVEMDKEIERLKVSKFPYAIPKVEAIDYFNCEHENTTKEQEIEYCSNCGLIMKFKVEF